MINNFECMSETYANHESTVNALRRVELDDESADILAYNERICNQTAQMLTQRIQYLKYIQCLRTRVMADLRRPP